MRYLLKDKEGVTPFRSLEELERKLSTMAQERGVSDRAKSKGGRVLRASKAEPSWGRWLAPPKRIHGLR